MKRTLTPAAALLGLGMFLVLWQVLAWIIHRPIMPSPIEVAPLFLTSFFGDLGLHFLASAGRVLAAIAVSVIIAVPIGLGLGQTPKLDRIFSPLVAIVYPIPKIVFLPVIYVLMGITDISKIFLIALIIFFQILVVVRDEAANLHPELILSVRSLGAGRRALVLDDQVVEFADRTVTNVSQLFPTLFEGIELGSAGRVDFDQILADSAFLEQGRHLIDTEPFCNAREVNLDFSLVLVEGRRR